jgi:hypothetical protein
MAREHFPGNGSPDPDKRAGLSLSWTPIVTRMDTSLA